MNATYLVANCHMDTNVLDRGLLGHVFDGYGTRFVKSEFATNQVDDLDAGAKAA